GELFRQVNVRLFLRFEEVRLKKRKVNRVAGGVVTFGSAPPPIRPYEGPTGRRMIKGPAAEVAAGPGDLTVPSEPVVPGREGGSSGNVNRGERIRTSDLLNPIQGCHTEGQVVRGVRRGICDDRFALFLGDLSKVSRLL